jgi:hypothetical protein
MSTKSLETAETTETASGDRVALSYDQVVTTMIDQLHAMEQQIPTFSFPAERNSTQKLTTAASVPRQAIDKVVALIETNPLLTGNYIGPDDLRDLVSFASAYGPLPDEMEATAQGLRHTVTAALNKAGSVVLMVYEMAKRQSKLPEYAYLRPHVADLKRLLGARFGKKKNRQQAISESQVTESGQASSPSESSQPEASATATDATASTPPTAPKSK